MDFQQQPNGYQPNPNYSYNMNQAPQRNYMDKRSTGLATASIALGIVGLVLTIALYAFVIVMMFTNADFINQMSNGNTADYNELMRQFNEMNQMYQ